MRAFVCGTDASGKSGYHPTGGCSANGCFVPVTTRNPNDKRFLVIEPTFTNAPQGTFDLGDPSDPGWQATPLTNPEKNFLTQTFPDGVMDAAETRGDALVALVNQHRDTRCVFSLTWGD